MKRKAAQPKQSSKEHSADSSAARQNHAHSHVYEEATGKTVDFIRYTEQSKGWPAFEIRFTDGMFLFVEPVPQVQFRVRLLKTGKGNVKILREYGITT
jgi:hypothetical protein